MPEIKHGFVKGKMNKDLDERLIPNGEYRHAMNIQVSTSEDSDIGTVQNILGTTRVDGVTLDGFQCVGSIADEKNDALYWFITNPNSGVDAILEYKKTPDTINYETNIVLADKNGDVLDFQSNTITGISIIDNLLFWTDNNSEPRKINIDRCKTGSTQYLANHTKLIVDDVNTGIDIREEHTTVVKKKPTIAPILELTPLGGTQLISGITRAEVNAVPFSFDGKKIDDSIEIWVDLETVELVPDGVASTQDITLNDGTVVLAGTVGPIYDYVGVPNIGDGDVILLSDPNAFGVLPNNYQIRVVVDSVPVIEQVKSAEWVVKFSCTILFISSATPIAPLQFDFVLEDLSEILFKNTFPRFSCRYKYEDGEYSSYGPFTDVAFISGKFSFHPTKEPYNSGMETRVKEIILKDFVTKDIPDDVVQIDLLYKQENSTNIYSIDSIKRDSLEWNDTTGSYTIDPSGSATTNHNKGYYKITNENIYAALPSNQLLRPWDNVPKAALAQEITSNRIVYGNYLQNLDISGLDLNLIAGSRKRLFNSSDTIDFTYGQKSLKSSRTYELGVVYGDKYGRETPVFTSKNASVKIPYDEDPTETGFLGTASQSNQLQATIGGTDPSSDDIYYYKLFVKETSGEYYNLTMDRVYKSKEDDNLWLSFPSSDRNKVKEDDYIILKKSLDKDEQVDLDNKFKIIDIKNEAPTFIKDKYTTLGEADGNGDLAALFVDSVYQPAEDVSTIVFSKISWVDAENLAELQQLFNEGVDLSMTFSVASGSTKQNSKRYDVLSLLTFSSGENYRVVLSEPINSRDYWVESSSGVLDTGLKMQIWKKENKEWEQFQGRFFVKILSNSITERYIESQIGIISEQTVTANMPIFFLADPSDDDTTDGITGITNKTTGNTLDTTASTDHTNTQSEWQTALEFPISSVDQNKGWFIDAMYFASGQPNIIAADRETEFDANSSGRLTRGNSASKIINGLEGIITATAYHKFDGSGRRMWRTHVPPSGIPSTYDDTYTEGKFYIHLSFSGVGVDLHPGIPSRSDCKNFKFPLGNIPATMGSGSGYSEGFLGTDVHNAGVNKAHDSFTASSTHNKWGQEIEVIDNIWNPTYGSESIHENNKEILKNLVHGARFKFDGNEEVYTITKPPVIKRLYNHTSWWKMKTVDSGGNYVFSEEDSVEWFYDEWESHSFPFSAGSANIASNDNVRDAVVRFGRADNRRVCYIIEVDKDPRDLVYGYNPQAQINATTHVKMKFLKDHVVENSTLLSDNPAIWETEAKEDIDLNIYYEASQAIPINLDVRTGVAGHDPENYDNNKGYILAPVGSKVWCSKSDATTGTTKSFGGLVVVGWDGNEVEISPGFIQDQGATTNDLSSQSTAFNGKTVRFFRDDLSFTSGSIFAVTGITSNLITKFTINRSTTAKAIGLPYFNCYSFGNGVESNRIRDDFNKVIITNGVRASTTLEEQYEQERRKNGLIYSGLYNSTSGVNNLNQFIMAEKITKDLNPTYGSIQKLFTRREDLVTFCEDRVLRIAADKNILYNADGKPQVVASDNVLGQAQPFRGDYGISKNPESFAAESFRSYFVDKQRGAVLRLSMDGLTPISDAGMKDYFRDTLKDSFRLIGTYDNYKNNYNLTIDTSIVHPDHNPTGVPQTLSFSETVRGWTSFKSFIPENGLSMANDYYTFFDGKLFKHNSSETRNQFHLDQPVPSTITAVLNDNPTVIKNFHTLNYDGDSGWVADLIDTDKQGGTVSEFIEKEGKWFNYIKGRANVIDTNAFNFQGIGTCNEVTTI